MEDYTKLSLPTVSLSSSERRILRELQANGRATNVELAARVGLSSTACWNQTQGLYKKGAIRSVRAILDPAVVGFAALAIVGVMLDRSTPDSFAAFEKAIGGLPNVLECFLVAGDVDYFLKVRVGSMPDFHLFHSKHLIPIPGVRQVRTFFVFSEVKSETALPL